MNMGNTQINIGLQKWVENAKWTMGNAQWRNGLWGRDWWENRKWGIDCGK